MAETTFEELLSDVQGNILKGFDKPNMLLIFLRFGSNQNDTKKWLADAGQRIPSTKMLIDASKEYNKRKLKDPLYHPQDVWLHVSLSKSGIDKLGLKVPPSTDVYIGGGAETEINQKNPDIEDHPFTLGMKSRGATELGDIDDSAPDHWVEPFKSAETYAKPLKGTEIDALFIVASDEEDDGDAYTLRLMEEATVRGIICIGLQRGKALENEAGKNAEHFGFRDGISQPLIKGIDDDTIEKRKINKDEFDPKDFILFGLEDDLKWANNGSFLVFRRLRQDVSAFWQFMKETSEKLNSQGVALTPEELAAKFVGRWKSGAPLALFPKSDPVNPNDPKELYNDFDYCQNLRQTGSVKDPVLELDDPRGITTPRFSHIRKANPRDDGRDLDGPEANRLINRTHRILRRGITYGVPWAKDPSPQADRGLLFICYQRDLVQQFEYIQKIWANNQEFPLPERDGALLIRHGPDPMSGQYHTGQPVHLLHSKGSKSSFKSINLSRWVTTTGGEYFFSPSISALKQLRTYLVEREAEPLG